MSRFFGGAKNIQGLYDQVFQPLYANASSFAPQQNSMSPSYAGQMMAPAGVDNFEARYAKAGNQFSRFQPSFSSVGQELLGKIFSPSYGQPTTGTTPTPTAGGVGSAGGSKYGALDAHNNEINAVAAKIGVPANLLKSVINRESSGNWARDGSRSVDPDGYGELVPFVGVRRATAASVGINYDQMIGNKALQIEAMARVLKRDYDRYGSYEMALSNYLTGNPNAYTTGGTDSAGLPANYYVKTAMDLWHELDGSSAGTPIGTSPGGLVGGGGYPAAGGSTPQQTNSVLTALQQYVGTPYVWGSAPGKGVKPTGWDCSGMTWWLDQNYGDGSLPQGSHFQYDYAQKTGKLFTNTGQLQAGDLLFFDTGWRGGGGANMNGASHVGIYLGNGKMIEAANPSAGTIISDISGRLNGQYLGAMHQSFSGGAAGAGAGATGTGTAPAINPNIFRANLRSNFASPWATALAGLGRW